MSGRVGTSKNHNKPNKKFWTAQPKAAQGKYLVVLFLFFTTQEKTQKCSTLPCMHLWQNSNVQKIVQAILLQMILLSVLQLRKLGRMGGIQPLSYM